jgi:hypothetical protein
MNALPALQMIMALLLEFLNTTPIQPEIEHATPSSKQAAVEAFAKVEALAKQDDTLWTAPFVLANLETKEIYIWGQHTGMNVGEPLEFFIIAENSGHDYESLMMAFAKPSDIHKALEKIGLKSGSPVDPDRHQFFPRGDRVSASVQWITEGQEKPVVTAIEEVALENGEVMKAEPWVFTGSEFVPSLENTDVMDYAADERSPNSIASTFNLRNTVFDLPRQGSKTQTYGTFIRNPGVKAPPGTPMILILKPAAEGSYPAPLDFTVSISATEINLTGDNAPVAADLAELGARLNERENEEHFLTVVFDEGLSLTEAVENAKKVLLIEQHVDSVHINPPLEGHLYYRAFIPDPRFRDRTKRPSQPIELHLSQPGETLKGTVMEITEIWGETRIPDIQEKRILVDTPEAWMSYLNEREEKNPVLFLYADGDTSHGDILAWLTPVLDQFPVVYIYLNEEE